MFYRNKKAYTLDYIEKLFTYIPKIFILVLGFSLIIISYFSFNSQQKKELNLIHQKQIINYEFQQKDNLYKFIDEVNEKVNEEFADVKVQLKQTVHETIGYFNAKYNDKLNIKDLDIYLTKMQKQQDIKLVVFEAENLNILYGQESITSLQQLLFNHQNQEKFKKLIVQYIFSQGTHNLQSWKYDFQKNMILSFFDIVKLNKKDIYIGAFSTVKNIQQTTKDIIIESINNMDAKLDYDIWFYDSNTKKTFNYNNKHEKIFAFKILRNNNKSSKKYEILDYYISNDNDNENKIFEKCLYVYSKYSFFIAIDYDKNSILKSNKNQINEIIIEYKILKYKNIFYIIILTITLMLFSFLFSKFIKRIFGKYNRSLQRKTDLLELHKKRVELLVLDEVEKNRKKDRILIQQSKLAAMGGMLENIAHQWRQPLNNVNLILHFLRDNYKNKEFTREQLEKYIIKSKIQIDYMSQTIDDFRNFYKPSKVANNFNIPSVIDNVLKISKEQFEHDNIEVMLDLTDIFIINYENELKQTLLNILYNAKDAIVLRRKKKEFNAFIKIKVIQNKEFAKILIENNGGKIKKNVIEKIFDPYFTTRAESLGTGIGLYMAKTIIETNMKGKIKVENIKEGVRFKIILPLKSILEQEGKKA